MPFTFYLALQLRVYFHSYLSLSYLFLSELAISEVASLLLVHF